MKGLRISNLARSSWVSELKILALLIFFSAHALSAKKRALIISIGDYPDNKELNQNWGDLSSSNDAEIINNLLIDQGFASDNIWSLKDENATASNIRDYLKKTVGYTRAW